MKTDLIASLTPTATPVTGQASYLYDGDGNLARGIVNGVMTFYPGRHYNREVDGANVTVKKFYTLGSSTVAVRTVQGSNDTLNWILSDHLGSASVTANADGTWNSEIKYTAFGEVRASYGLTPTDYRYTGQLDVAELGLVYFVARFYDPVLTHFVQADTLIPDPYNPLAWDRYAYADWNPIRYSDPTGHRVCEGTSSCNPLPKSTYTKQYYQQQLNNQFSWFLSDDFSYKQSKYLYEKAWEWRLNFSNVTSGHGEEWMSKNLGYVKFEVDTWEQKKISQLNGDRPTSFVYDKTIHFSENFMDGKDSDVHVFHEVSHVWDNNSANDLSRGLGKLPTIFGGGIADELIK